NPVCRYAWQRSPFVRSFPTRRSSDLAVVMLSGGGTVKIDAANSPYAVPARTDDTRSQKARTLVQAGLGFLAAGQREAPPAILSTDRKSTRLNSSHDQISYAVFCLKKK